MDSKKIFFVGVIIAASGLVSPPLALLAGIVFGFSVAHPYRAESHLLAKFLLQASVIGLGFGMNLHEVIHAGRSGFVYTAISITFAIALGLLLGKWMKIAPKASFLITGESLWMVQVAELLKQRMGKHAGKVSTRVLPNTFIRAAALTNMAMKCVVPLLGVNLNATGDKAKHVLGWTPRSPEDAIIASAESLVRLGLVS